MSNLSNLSTCSLTAFSAAVLAAVSTIGTAPDERFGDRKVFIAAIAAKLGVPVSTDFAVRLIAASRLGLLELARADLVAAMNRDAVAGSQISEGNTEYHFVIDPSAQDPWLRAAMVRAGVRQTFAALPDFVQIA